MIKIIVRNIGKGKFTASLEGKEDEVSATRQSENAAIGDLVLLHPEEQEFQTLLTHYPEILNYSDPFDAGLAVRDRASDCGLEVEIP